MAQIRNVARFVRVKAMTTVRNVDLVVPLSIQATAMRTADTAGLVAQGRSGAVSSLTDRDSRLRRIQRGQSRRLSDCRCLVLLLPGDDNGGCLLLTLLLIVRQCDRGN